MEVMESPSPETCQTHLDAVLCHLRWATQTWQGVGPGELQRSLPTLTVLWVCECHCPVSATVAAAARAAGHGLGSALLRERSWQGRDAAGMQRHRRAVREMGGRAGLKEVCNTTRMVHRQRRKKGLFGNRFGSIYSRGESEGKLWIHTLLLTTAQPKAA